MLFTSAIGWPPSLAELVPGLYYQWVDEGRPCVWYAEQCEGQDWKRLAEAWKNTGIRQKFEEWARKLKILPQGSVVAEFFVEWVRQGSPAEGKLQMTAAWLETTGGGS